MICYKCGSQILDGSAFCQSCGAPMQQNAVPVQNAVPMQGAGMRQSNLIGIVSAVVMFICVFLPILTKIKDYSSESFNMLSSVANEVGMMGWMVLVLSVAIAFLYAVPRESLAFFVSLLNLIKFIHVWSVAEKVVQSNDFVHYGVGFYLYLIATVIAILPFIWMKVKQSGNQVCPNCGAPLGGYPNFGNSVICPICGASVQQGAVSMQSTVPAQTAGVGQSVQQMNSGCSEEPFPQKESKS